MKSEAQCRINAIRVVKLLLSSTVSGPVLGCEAALIHEGEGPWPTMAETKISSAWPWPKEVVEAATNLITAVERSLIPVFFDEAGPESAPKVPQGIVLFEPAADPELVKQQL